MVLNCDTHPSLLTVNASHNAVIPFVNFIIRVNAVFYP